MHRESYLKNEKEMVSRGNKLTHEENPKMTEEEREIMVMQARKAQIMDALHDELHTIDTGSGTVWGHGQVNRDVMYDEKRKSFFVDCNGVLGTATLGDMIADVALGCEYNVPIGSVPREVTKHYVLERAKVQLNQLFNRQLALQEEKEARKKDHFTRAQHFKEARAELDIKEKGMETHAGKLFEQSVQHILKELQYDLPELELEVHESNIVQDMDEKIDFIVRIHEHHRGTRIEESRTVSTEASEKHELFGIQFTINTSEETHKKKEEQINKSKEKGTKVVVDDIVLVTVPMSCKEIVTAHTHWRAQGCPPGGPARLYPAEVRAEIVQKVLEKIGSKKDEEGRKEKIEKYFKTKS